MKDWLFFDLEASAPEYKDSVDPSKARVIQMAFILGSDEPKMACYVNPGFSIPPEITELTGVTNERLANAKPFAEHAVAVAELIRGKTLAGYNCHRYDVPLLAEEFERAGLNFDWHSVTVVDIGTLFALASPRNLAAACREYLGAEPTSLHDAYTDARATAAVAAAMMATDGLIGVRSAFELQDMTRYGVRMADPAGRLCYNAAGELCFNTHRNKGVPVQDDIGYARWMLRQDFPRATRRVLVAEIGRLQPVAAPGLFPDAN
jgi:DNA polymerase-3 subunit epsilon